MGTSNHTYRLMVERPVQTWFRVYAGERVSVSAVEVVEAREDKIMLATGNRPVLRNNGRGCAYFPNMADAISHARRLVLARIDEAHEQLADALADMHELQQIDERKRAQA